MDSELYKDKCLFLWLNETQFHAVEAKKRGIDVAQVYKNYPSFLRLIRRVQLKLKIPWIQPWLNDWYKKLDQFETVIIHASKITPLVVKFIRKSNPNMRIIVWYWNPVDKTIPVSEFTGYNCEVWSFDEEDCEKYDLKYNTQYYFNDVDLRNNEIEFDILFVGGDKGRIAKLLKLQDKINALGASTYFHVTNTGHGKNTKKEIYKERISYEDILKLISKSNTILDYVSENQSGLTLRPLEALYFKKKLITNDASLRKRDFYKPENIFIIGIDDLINLKSFINKPFNPVDEIILDKYDFNNWLNRFRELGDQK